MQWSTTCDTDHLLFFSFPFLSFLPSFLHTHIHTSPTPFPFALSPFSDIEFGGWTDADSVQSHINRIKEQLPDDESKRMMDALIPSVAVNMLHKRLTGRFRPIITAIEGIIKTGVPDTWKNAIDITETMLTSWKERERRGNLCGELNR